MKINIGGFQPVSMNNFPGRVAAVIFTQGCNLKCPFCHNGGLIEVKDGLSSFYGPDLILERILQRRHLLDGVVISGGEPTIHQGLFEICDVFKEAGLEIKLDTNGTNPEFIADLLERGSLDFVALDVKAPFEKYKLLAGTSNVDVEAVSSSISLVAQSGVKHLFRTTLVPKLLSKEDTEKIKKIIPHGSPHIFQPFKAETALDPGLRKKGTGSKRRSDSLGLF